MPAPTHRVSPEEAAAFAARLAGARPRLVLSPPRCASTALCRALSRHPAVGPYIHEPFDRFWHHGRPLGEVERALVEGGVGPGALIKEMTFQLGDGPQVEAFFGAVRHPILVLVRAPALTIESRVRMVGDGLLGEGRLSPADADALRAALEARDFGPVGHLFDERVFPLRHAGWRDLRQHLALCRARGIPFFVVDASRFRAEPEATLRAICGRWSLDYDPRMLDWGDGDFEFGALPEQRPWYARVVASRGVLPPTEEPLSADRLPPRLAAHIAEAESVAAEALGEAGLAV